MQVVISLQWEKCQSLSAIDPMMYSGWLWLFHFLHLPDDDWNFSSVTLVKPWKRQPRRYMKWHFSANQ